MAASTAVLAPTKDLQDRESAAAVITTNDIEDEETAAGISKTYWERRTSVCGYSVRQVTTLVFLGLANFCLAVFISLQAPFYPAEAEAKGASPTEYGLVFGVFEFTSFLTAPLFGKFLPKLGARNVFNVGLITSGCATIFFGFLDRFNDRRTFIALSFVTRIVESLGQAGFSTAVFSITAAEFPTAIATTFAFLETFFGLGTVAGPTLGGALYEAGGFTIPFAVMGGLTLAVGVITCFVMPDQKTTRYMGEDSPGVFAVLKIPAVALCVFSIAASSMSIGFLSATLEPHIRQYGLQPILTGGVFIINGALYAISAPIWGWISDRWMNPKVVALVGSIFVILSFLFIGPVSFIPVETQLWLVCVCLALHGTGLGAIFVSSFNIIMKESIAHGLGDNIGTYGLCSGLWLSSFALGNFIGPSVGGYLLDQVGFRSGTICVLAVQALLTILLGIFSTRNSTVSYREINYTEAAPLLASGDHNSEKTLLAAVEQEKPSTSYGAL